MKKDIDSLFRPAYKICVSGASETGHCSKDALEQAAELGREIAKKGIILLTGATPGIPYWAAKGAKEEGGVVIGFSPASSKMEHVKKYKLPLDFHNIIIYTGFNYSGRNLILNRSADGIIFTCGRMGTLNEFTIGFEDKKPLAVLEGSGGTSDMIRKILENAHKGMGKTIFSKDPVKLVDGIISQIKKDEKRNHTEN
ncbi:MAG: hypothetical protein WD095_00855 [Candidatus Paceibacterota bacterium]